MTRIRLAFALAISAASPCAFAQTAVAPENVTAGDVMTKPLSDLNMKKDDAPPILIAAREKPYDLTGLRTCRAIQSEVGQLNAALGDDIDVAVEKTRNEKRGNTVGSIARSVLSSFIPFNGVIREVSGAAGSDRDWQVTLYAGASRRAFLKGYGQARGCRYPARGASAADVSAVVKSREAEHNAAEVAKKMKKRKKQR